MNIQLDGRGGQAAPGLSSDCLRRLRIWQACWHRAVEAELISAGNSGRYRMIRSHTVPFWVFCSLSSPPTLLTWIISHQHVCVKTQALIWSDETLPTPPQDFHCDALEETGVCAPQVLQWGRREEQLIFITLMSSCQVQTQQVWGGEGYLWCTGIITSPPRPDNPNWFCL